MNKNEISRILKGNGFENIQEILDEIPDQIAEISFDSTVRRY